MSLKVEYLLNKASEAEISEHLTECDSDFTPPLSGRVEINNYAMKIANKAIRFEAWSDRKLIGLIAAYCNNQESRNAYITSVSVLREWTGKGIAAHLMNQCIEYVKAMGMRQISLEVANGNAHAIKLYKKTGFVLSDANAPFVSMNLYLANEGKYE
jgi:ribosomal protein S18 acetylase RimI-like enzyme